MTHPKMLSLFTLVIVLASAPVVLADPTLYGRLGVSVDSISSDELTGSDFDFRAFQVSSNNSFVGLRGADELNNGLRAIYQVELGAGLDAESSTNPNSVYLRNSFVGLSGDFGTVRIGHLDSPYKTVGQLIDPFSDTIADANAILGRDGGNSHFNNRFSNSIAYLSPSFNGFSLNTTFSADTGPKDDNLSFENSSRDPNADTAFSSALDYQALRFFAGAAFESIKENEGATTIKAAKAYAQMRFGDEGPDSGNTLGVVFESLDLEGIGDMYRNPSHKNIFITGTHQRGSTRYSGSFGQAGQWEKYDGFEDETDASFFALGCDRMLSNNTNLWMNYSSMSNGDMSSYGLGQVEDNCSHFLAQNGQGSQAFSVGIIHNF